jgi:hypothetical protein
MNRDDLNSIFRYLDRLRDSGAVNMFGVRLMVSAQFGIDKGEAGKALAAWMGSYDPDKTVDARVDQVLEGQRA